MSDWSESWLREAAGWRAIKEGRALLAAGSVEEASAQGDTCRGSVREGRGPRRVVVRQVSRHDVEVRCGCPENRATGALCCHGVAVVLAALRGPRATNQEAAASPPQAAPVPPPVAVRIEVSPKWIQEIARGRLTLKVGRDSGRDPGAMDAPVSAWLAERNALPGASARVLQVSGVDLQSLLAAWIGHPAVFLSDGTPLHRSGDPAPVIVDCDPPTDGRLELRLVPARQIPLLVGNHVWHWDTESRVFHRARAAPAGWSNADWHDLCLARPTRLPLAVVLAALGTDDRPFDPIPTCWLARFHVATVRPQFELQIEGHATRAEARLTAVYPAAAGEERVPVRAPAPQGQGTPVVLRADEQGVELTDPGAETAAAASLLAAGFLPAAENGGFRLSGREAVLEFVTGHLPEFRRRWRVRETPAWLAAHRNVAVVAPVFEVLRSGVDWLEFNLDLATADGHAVPRELVAKLLRSKDRSIKANDGNDYRIPGDELEWLEGTLRDLDVRQEGGCYRVSQANLAHFQYLHENQQKALNQNRLQNTQTNAANVFSPAALGSLGARLRSYQSVGVGWLLDRLRSLGAALLADDMGLGKTIQTIAAIKLMSDCEPGLGPSLVVCPTSLVGNWCDEFARFAPELRVSVLHGAGRDGRFDDLDQQDVAVTTYGSLVRDRALHLKREYRLVVLDEASMIRNPEAEVSRCVAKLRARARLALTGTPLENRLGDLWSLFRFLRPGYLGSREGFRDTFELPCAQGKPARAVTRRLRDRIGPFLLRRTKSEVAAELPPKVEILDWCELSGIQRGYYSALLREGAEVVDEARRLGGSGAARLKVLTALLRLRQACCDLRLLGAADREIARIPPDERSGKLSRLRERLREAVDGEHRVLVFSQFATMLGHIREVLETDGIGCCLLDGSTRDRGAEVARFRAPDGPPVFLISLKAGGYGLNLPEADTVIHYDPWWNPAVEAQASDRAHRIGQTRPVTVYKLLTRGTVEEKVLRLQERKRELLASALGNAEEDGLGAPDRIENRELYELLDNFS